MFLKIKNSLMSVPFWLRSLILVCLIFGIILRVYHLGGKLYSNDETYSTTYIYGSNLTEIIDSKIVSVSELQKYQRFNPDESLFESFGRIIRRPYIFPPILPFLVQIVARFMNFFTSDPAVITRSGPALVSLFSLPLMYWLCWELFQSTLIAWFGAAMIAISPFHLQYSQIVRPYSLITVTILLSTSFLLFSKRNPSRINWMIYGVCIGLGLYSSPLFGFAIISHALYMIVSYRAKFTQVLRQYIYASLVGIFLFIPWFYLYTSRPGLVHYSVGQVGGKSLNIFYIFQLVPVWARNIPRIFTDFVDKWLEFTLSFEILQKLVFPLVLALVLASLGFLATHAFKDKNWLIISLIIGGGGILIGSDLLLSTALSMRLRYMLAYVIGLQLAVIAFISFLYYSRSSWQRKLGEITISGLLVLGLISCLIIDHAPSWWAVGAPDYPLIAEKINQFSKPVVLYNDFSDALTMSYLVKDNVYSHLTRREEFHLKNNLDFYKDYSDIVIFRPGDNLVKQLEDKNHLKLEPLFKSKGNYPGKPDAWKVSVP